jgi:hypothetical protein
MPVKTLHRVLPKVSFPSGVTILSCSSTSYSLDSGSCAHYLLTDPFPVLSGMDPPEHGLREARQSG